MSNYDELLLNEVRRYLNGEKHRFSYIAEDVFDVYKDRIANMKTEQDKEEIAYDIYVDLTDREGIWDNDYEFEYKERKYREDEFDGTVINAPDEETAWIFFLNTESNNYNYPYEDDYYCYRKY